MSDTTFTDSDYSSLIIKLVALRRPVLSRFDLAREAWLLRDRKLQGDEFQALEQHLIGLRYLEQLQGEGVDSFYVVDKDILGKRNELICLLDPFCYISHLSAMEYHGLTDRLPELVYNTSPDSKEWAGLALTKMKRELGLTESEDLRSSGFNPRQLPILTKPNLTKVAGMFVRTYTSKFYGSYRVIKDSPVRVATIGRTFLDMLKDPGLCGGMTHVVQTFIDNARSHLELIVSELNQHGRDIDKIRAGFLLDEVCGVVDPRIDEWATKARRGGSSKLDPAAEYDGTAFSERWKLSINAIIPKD